MQVFGLPRRVISAAAVPVCSTAGAVSVCRKEDACAPAPLLRFLAAVHDLPPLLTLTLLQAEVTGIPAVPRSLPDSDRSRLQ